jgi:hypothetical protein
MKVKRRLTGRITVAALVACAALLQSSHSLAASPDAYLNNFIKAHCLECHDADTRKGNLSLEPPPGDFTDPEAFSRWVHIYNRVDAGEMPPQKKERPPRSQIRSFTRNLRDSLLRAERQQIADEPRTPLRRLTRGEYENTIRDLFDLPGIALQGELPADGSAHGFDNNADALDISHVNLARYLDAADHTLDLAIATRPTAPAPQKRRISLANPAGFVAHVLLNGDGVLLRDQKPDPEFPPAGDYNHLDQGAHERMESFSHGASVGLFRHEDESMSPYFMEHVTVYPGLYRVRTSLWSFQWDKGSVLPARGTEAARLSVVQLTGDGRGGQHPSYVLGYYDAPSLQPTEHEVVTWLNYNEIIGFNVASLAPVANYSRKGRAMAFTGPGIACDWLDVEGPLHTSWPPASHKLLFGDLPIAEFKPAEHPGVRPPLRPQVPQLGAGAARNQREPIEGIWSVRSEHPLEDADRLLSTFLPRAFRRPVDDSVRTQYVAQVAQRLAAGDTFESALRWTYRAALCSPDFLYHLEPPGPLDDFALASRLSYFLWNSLPDASLIEKASTHQLRSPKILVREAERLLADPKSQRFIQDFTGQWLKLRQIAANDPDRKLYPEFSPYLQDSMVAETRAYFRELIDRNLPAECLVRSDFAMINEKLAAHYGIPGVNGSQIRRVPLPPDSPRGGFLTQAAVLKVSANGTTTSPVVRGAFVMARILGQPPEPPPPNIPAVEPDVRGATTIREQLAKHRHDPTCASCHAQIDPPGFALESFDVIGGFRSRYRSIGNGDPAPRGNIDPFIDIGFKLGPPVDPSGNLPGGETFKDIHELQSILAAHPRQLLSNLARQFAIYSTGRPVNFSDQLLIEDLVSRTLKQGGGIRTLLLEWIASPLFQTR